MRRGPYRILRLPVSLSARRFIVAIACARRPALRVRVCAQAASGGIRFAALLLALVAGCDAVGVVEQPPEPRRGRGATVSVEPLAELSVGEVNGLFSDVGLAITARFPVASYAVVYETVDAHGEVTRASGAISLPVRPFAPLPVVSYQHGTSVRRIDVPSASENERIIGIAFAATGYLAAMPDYLGLGESPGLHPYVHAATSATAVVDMLRAATDFATDRGWELAGELFLIGYSQGGYATMAAHRALEADHTNEFTVTATAPMAGPYDLSGVMADVVTSDQPYPSPYYVPYVLLAYNDIYGLYESPSQFLKSPYDVQIPPLFDGAHSADAINALLPEVPRKIIWPDVLASFENDLDDPFRRRLRENDLYDWAPRAPVRLYHCEGDTFVPKENSVIAERHMRQRGADVRLIDPLPVADHGLCAPFSLLLAKYWFDSLRAPPVPN